MSVNITNYRDVLLSHLFETARLQDGFGIPSDGTLRGIQAVEDFVEDYTLACVIEGITAETKGIDNNPRHLVLSGLTHGKLLVDPADFSSPLHRQRRRSLVVTVKTIDTSSGPAKCNDCGCHEGSLHDHGCARERCPFCGRQLISCRCVYDHFSTIGDQGLTPDQEAQWYAICAKKGRFPYIAYPYFCAYCGEYSPEFFKVPDEEWENVIQPDMRSEILCRKCYGRIKEIVLSTRS